MATSVVYNGVTYSIPAYGDVGYAQGPGNLSAYLIALASGSPQATGGLFSLTAPLNFGPNFGLLAVNYSSTSANPASAGTIRLANTDTIDWRNFANSGNDVLGVNTSDQLTYNGSVIALTSGSSGIVNPGLINQLAFYATSGSAVSGDAVLLSVSDGLQLVGPLATGFDEVPGNSRYLGINQTAAGAIVNAALSVAAISEVVGAGASSIAFKTSPAVNTTPVTQFTIAPTTLTSTVPLAMGTNKVTGVAPATVAGDAIEFGQTGATLSGLAVSAAKITGLANGTVATDAAAFGQIGGMSGTNAAGYIIGTVVQVVSAVTTVDTNVTSSTFTATGVSLSITPKATTHKIIVTATGALATASGNGINFFATLERNGTNLFSTGGGAMMRSSVTGLSTEIESISLQTFDSPASTSAQTYAVYIKNSDNATSVSFPAGLGSGVSGVIIAQEIAF
jgi:hypothetical protein